MKHLHLYIVLYDETHLDLYIVLYVETHLNLYIVLYDETHLNLYIATQFTNVPRILCLPTDIILPIQVLYWPQFRLITRKQDDLLTNLFISLYPFYFIILAAKTATQITNIDNFVSMGSGGSGSLASVFRHEFVHVVMW